MRTETVEREVFKCPLCSNLAVKIDGSNFWSCASCDHEFMVELRPVPKRGHSVMVKTPPADQIKRVRIYDGDRNCVALVQVTTEFTSIIPMDDDGFCIEETV